MCFGTIRAFYLGKGDVEEYLTRLLESYGTNVLLAYVGGSGKKNGVYDAVASPVRAAGKTIEKVSVLGYGNMRLPVAHDDYAKIDVAAALKLVHHATGNGVNYLDTSWPYRSVGFTSGDSTAGGSSEPFVGKVLKEVGRDKVFVATKLPIWLVQTRNDLDKYLNKQLERLGTDYVDFYIVHKINPPAREWMMNLDIASFLDRIKKEGKARHVGFTFHGTPALFQQVIDYYSFAFCKRQGYSMRKRT